MIRSFIVNTLIFVFITVVFHVGVAQPINQAPIAGFDLEAVLRDGGYQKIALTKMESGHLRFSVLINGVNADLILDTGAGGTFIERNKGEDLRLKTKESETKATGAGGTGLNMKVSENNKIQIGKLVFSESKILLMSLDHVNIAFERMGLDKVDGVMGADFLTRADAVIDYNTLALYLKK